MKLGQKLGKVGVAAWVVLSALGSAQANQKFCVYDMLGATGDLYNMTKDYAVAMQRNGVTIELKGYTDERVATEDFRTGQCDAVIGTAFRIRQFLLDAPLLVCQFGKKASHLLFFLEQFLPG